MAYYAALTSIVQLLDDTILHHRYPTFLLANHPLVKSLHHKFTCLEESLQHYSSNGYEVCDRLEGRIRDVAYQARDIIEIEISNQICLQERASINRTCSEERINIMKKSSPMSCFRFFKGKTVNMEDSSVEETQMVEQETNSIVEELLMVEQEADSILEEMVAIEERQGREQPKLIWDSSAIPAVELAPGAKNIMVGFDEDLVIIKDHLCGHSSQLQVIPIVGMGGIGKTTLARSTFDDTCVEYHFHCRAWVTISQDYHENAILQSILESLGLAMKKLHGGEEMDLKKGDPKESIYKCLKGRQYLIVVDDIWSTQVWDDLKRIFPNDCNGSRIILTTRLLDVAQYAISSSGFLHEMQLLNKEKSWNLLQKKVFAEECCPPELEDIGMLIASKCGGLPLAIVVIAGILSNFRTLHHWEKIAGKVSTILSNSDEEMNRILSLSYNHLPHQLKACFLYLGGFPEDYEINVSNLVRLWIADGLLKSNDSCKFAEKVGEECIEDLVKRNLVLIKRKSSNSQFKICILHDLVRDFCRQRAFEELFFHVEDSEGHRNPLEIGKIRRIYTVCRRACSPRNIGKLARSVNLFTVDWGKFDFSRVFAWEDVELLRILNSSRAVSSSFSHIPEEIFRLRYLKYFSFKMTVCKNVSILSSLFQLQNLETLILDLGVSEPIILPSQIWQMTHLRHVIIPGMILPSISMIGGRLPSRKLECLQTLMTVVDSVFSNEVIEMIPNLRKLKVRGAEPSFWNFFHLPHLEELKVEDHQITSYFFFPSSLTKLSLSYCHIMWEDMTKVGSLPNLQVLKLGPGSFLGEQWDSVEGEFTCLKFLQLHGLELMHWRAEDTHFPRLEYLRILSCKNLMIPLEIGDIPTLKVIEVLRSDAAANSAIQIQENQRDMGNDDLHVRIYDHCICVGERLYLLVSLCFVPLLIQFSIHFPY